MEGSARGVHLLPLVDPLVLSELRVEGPLLQPAHLQREPRSQLLVFVFHISADRPEKEKEKRQMVI